MQIFINPTFFKESTMPNNNPEGHNQYDTPDKSKQGQHDTEASRQREKDKRQQEQQGSKPSHQPSDRSPSGKQG